ncbi:hypothetical protein V1264_020337 [Littorina saxatilis]|uniref:DUF7869 domain-containing protein n=1 Tax=Littorina saxatilis TaxID=31220 RepID=A0AAN9GCP3_9CAEN
MNCSIQGTVIRSFQILEGLSEDNLICNETLEDGVELLSPVLPTHEDALAPDFVQGLLLSPIPSFSCQSGSPSPIPPEFVQAVSHQDTPCRTLSDHEHSQTAKEDSQDTLNDDKITDSDDSYHPLDDENESTDSYEIPTQLASPVDEMSPLPPPSPTPLVSSVNKGKKRRKASDGMARENKELRLKGQAYMGRTTDQEGKQSFTRQKKQRQQGPACISDFCRRSQQRHCNEISDEERSEIFSMFWKELDWGQRKTYVSSMVNYVQVKRRRGIGRREGSFEYHLNVRGERLQVCKTTFLETLALKEWSVRSWVLQTNRPLETQEPSPPPSVKTTQNKTNEKSAVARMFIEQLPKVPSHYCRKDSKKLYLETIIQSKTHLYKLFKEFCDENGQQRVSRATLMRELKAMNIAIFKPRKDQCNLCLSYKYGQVSKEEYDTHIKRKVEAQTEKKLDKRIAEDDSDTLVITANYYKSKLCCHNYTLYDLATRDVVCYYWHEGNGEVNSSNFASCLLDYLQNVQGSRETPLRTIIMYSDGCGYQNRNVTLSNCLLHFAIRTGIEVVQKYLEKGHTWMEVDSVHSAIERKLRDRQIYWPPEYVEVISSARQNAPYKVKSLDFTFFKDFSKVLYVRSIRPGNGVGDPHVTDIRALRYSPCGTISYKLMLSDGWQVLPRRPAKVAEDVVIPNLYQQPRRIKKKKWQDLQELKLVLPTEYHSFYEGLQHE